jgi:hypothetical protein
MRRFCLAVAVAGIFATPAVAQSQAPAQQAPAAEQKTEKKVVCQRVAAEQATGSRFGSTTRVCKTVEVPVERAGEPDGKSDPASRQR